MAAWAVPETEPKQELGPQGLAKAEGHAEWAVGPE